MDQADIVIAVDVGPLLTDEPTGIARYVHALAFGAAPYVRGVGFATSWNHRKEVPTVLPPQWQPTPPWRRRCPAGLAAYGWKSVGYPSVRYWIGRSPSVVHATNYIVPPLHGVKAVVSVHDLAERRMSNYSGQGKSVLPGLRRAAREGAFFHCPTQAVADDVIEFLNIDASRVFVIRYGIDLQSIGVIAAAAEPAIAEPYFIAVGTLEPRKRMDWLVRAFDDFAETHPGTRLKIVGSKTLHPEGAAKVEQATSAARNGSRIELVGYLDDEQRKFDLMRSASALIIASEYEGFGFPILEAWSVGCPVISTRVGGLSQVGGDAVAYFDLEDADTLMQEMDNALTGTKEVEARRQQGHDRVQGYGWEHSIVDHLAMYAAIAAS